MIPRPAERTRAKIKLNLSGGAGTGKTYSALLVAFGLVGKWEKIIVIDAERSAHLYAHVPDEYGCKGQRFLVLPLEVDNCTPEQYILAIDACIAAGAEVIIIDGISQEWKSILDFIDANGGGTAWNKATPRHNKFIEKIIKSDVHIITTCRRVTDTVIVQNERGKNVPMEVGMKDVMREGYAHEVTIHGYMDEKHMLTVKKDRTQVFMKKEGDAASFMPTIETGKKIKKWCDDGKDIDAEMQSALSAISKCDSAIELSVVCDSYDFLIAEKGFLDAIRLRATVCLENYNEGDEILQNWLALPMFLDDADLNRQFKLRCIELVHAFPSVEALQAFWISVCGSKEAPTAMKYLRNDTDFVQAVTLAKETLEKKAKEQKLSATADPFDEQAKPATKDGFTGDGTKEKPLKRVYPKAAKKSK